MMPADDNAEFEVRPDLKRTRPHRHAGGFYRTADSESATLAGIPLVNAEDAVVAAVRMGYKVAEAQIDRSARLARRLRDAGDRAVGPDSPRQALDAGEKLVFRTMMSALAWLEGVAADEGSPLKRLALAEYRLLGSMLGLKPADAHKPSPTPAAVEPFSGAGAQSAPAARASDSRPMPRIVHRGKERRAVQVRACEIAADAASFGRSNLTFYSLDNIRSKSLEGELTLSGKGGMSLALDTPRFALPGPWRAAICDDTSGLQLGYIEIVL